MTISVIIPCFNSEKTIKRAVDSVINQSLAPFEIILINDCSTDNTENVIFDIKDRYKNINIKYIKLEKNSGPGKARNVAWDIAKGKYIAFLDADDSWHKDKLLLQHRVFEENPQLQICSTVKKVISYNTNTEINENINLDNINYRFVTFNNLLMKNSFSTPTVMLKRDLSFRFPDRKFSEDYMLWLLIGSKYPNSLAIVNIPLVYLYKNDYGDSGLSSHLWLMEKGELSNYLELYRIGNISIYTLCKVLSFSYFKYLIRVIKCQLRK